MANLREDTHVHDSLGIKVNRYNSWQNRVKRGLGISPKVKPNANCSATSLNLAEHTYGCGFLTAQVRRWDDELNRYNPWVLITQNQHNLLTNGGRDFFHQQCYASSGLGTNGTNWVAVTNQASFTPAPTDGPTMVGEVTTSGFARIQATGGGYSHTAGTNATTLTVTYTATGSVTAVQGSGLFTASTVGTLSHEATFTSTNFVSGDQLGLTWTLNLG